MKLPVSKHRFAKVNQNMVNNTGISYNLYAVADLEKCNTVHMYSNSSPTVANR